MEPTGRNRGTEITMSVLDPKADAAAIQPVIDEAVERAAKAFGAALQAALDGLTINIVVMKK